MAETSTKQQYTARLRYLHIAPRKVRQVVNTLRGLPVQEAEAQLLMRVERSTKPLLKLLRSAMANIQHEEKRKPEGFFIRSLVVDPGPMLKRSLPRAQGRATPIQKKQSHVTLVLERALQPVSSRFTFIPKEKKQKKDKKPRRTEKTKAITPAGAEAKKETGRREEKPGFLRRIFRRKSV